MAFHAFISYNQEEDRHLAAQLQRALHGFAKPWYLIRAARIFRDETNLTSETSIRDTINRALVSSKFLILMACEKSAASYWVNREIELWLDEDPRGERILFVLTGGDIHWNLADNAEPDFDWTRTTALPTRLSGKLASEPMYIDLRWMKQNLSVSALDPRFRTDVARLAARIHNKSLDEIAGLDVAQHRRTRQLTIAALALISLLGVAAVVEAVRAMRGQAAAERNLERALEGTDRMVQDIAEGLMDVRNMPTPTTRKVLSDANNILGELASEVPEPSLFERMQMSLGWKTQREITREQVARRRARSLSDLAAINSRAGCASTAIELAKTAVGLLDRLALKTPDDPEVVVGRVMAITPHGDALRDSNDWVGGIKVFERAAAVVDPALPVSSDTKVRREKFQALNKAAEVLGPLQQKWTLAEPLFETIAKGRRELIGDAQGKLAPNSPEFLHLQEDLAETLASLGDTRAGLAHMEDALASLREALAIIQEVTAKSPDDRAFLRLRSLMELKIGDLLVEKQPEAAIALFQSALVTREGIAKDDPGDTRLQRDLSRVYIRLGDAAQRKQQHELALGHFEQASRISNRLLDGPSCSPAWVFDRAVADNGRGVALEGLSRHGDAVEAFRAAAANGRKELACRKNAYSVWNDIVTKASTALTRIQSAKPDLPVSPATEPPDCGQLCKVVAPCPN